MSILTQDKAFEFSVPVVIVGGGGCGLCAGLAARGAGVDVLVLERDDSPLGTTAMSTGLIPAAGSKQQKDAGIEDSPELLAQDIVTKAKGQTDEAIAFALARESACTVDWLTDEQDMPLTLRTTFDKSPRPGKSFDPSVISLTTGCRFGVLGLVISLPQLSVKFYQDKKNQQKANYFGKRNISCLEGVVSFWSKG